MSTSSSFHVLIIGAGLGGLALANGLTRKGIRCTLFERDATPHDRLQGYRIVLRNELHNQILAMDAIRDLLSDRLYDKLLSMAGDGGHTATDTDVNLAVRSVFNLPKDSFSLGRMAIRDVMLEGLDTDVVQFGKKFQSYERCGDKIIVKFEDGQEVGGDLLVAADGGNSPVRRQFFTDHDPRIVTGVSGVVGKIPASLGSEAERIIQRTPLRDGMTSVSKPGRMFYASRHILRPDQERLDEDFLWSNHRSYIYWVLNTSLADVQTMFPEQSPHKLSGDQLLTHASELVNEFHPDVQTLIRQSDPATVVWLDFNSGEATDWKTDSQITFLGDSIHGMTPYLGAGALLAIVDAWELSKALVSAVKDGKNLKEAIEQYEIEMRKRNFPIMQMALKRMLKVTDPKAMGSQK